MDIEKGLKAFVLGGVFAVAVSLCALIGSAINLVSTATDQVAHVDTLVTREADETRKMLGEKVDVALAGVMGEVNTQANLTRSAAVKQLQEVEENLVVQIALTRRDLNDRAKDGLVLAHVHAGAFEDRLDDTNKILLETMRPIHGIAQQVNEAAPLFLDCDHNPNCVFNRYVGMSRAAERSMQDFSTALPILTKEFEQTGNHIDSIAGSVDVWAHRKPVPWWKATLP